MIQRNPSALREFEAARMQLARLKRAESGSLDRLLDRALEICSRALCVGRVGVWLLDPAIPGLRCTHLYDTGDPTAKRGEVLLARDLGAYATSLAEQNYIASRDVLADPQTAAIPVLTIATDNRTAERLAQSYPAEHLREKIALLEWKLRQAGHRRRIGDPAAWLVQAIEQDYRPPARFRPDAGPRRAVQAALEFTRQEPDGAAVDVPQTAWQRALDALRQQHGTTAAEIDLWAEALAEIKGATTRATFQTWFVQTEILALRDGHAIIAVPNRATKEWLLGRLSPVILRALQDVVGASVAIKMVVYDE